MIRLFCLILVVIFGCSEKTTVKYEDYLKGKTYLQIIERSDGYVLFDPCDSNILKYTFGETLYIGVGQDEVEYHKWKIKKVINDSIYIKVHENPVWEELLRFKLDTVNKYLFNNGNIYKASIHTNAIPYIKEPCENCWDKELCDEWAKQEEEKRERPKYIKQWHGIYSFGYGGVQMGEEFEGNVTFTIKDTLSKVAFANSEEPLDIAKATADTIHLKNASGDTYKIYKGEKGDINVSGHKIYLLNPPNESYLLTKEH